jgi:glucose/arabinose dehydrogenase
VFIAIFCYHKTDGINVSFIPEPIHITVVDLPKPYATLSYNKNPNVIPVPEDPALYVPDGFTVKLYMSDLRMPRYLIYTPTGDILVSEPNANRVSCLIDNDGDGYPDERTTFADASNGLNRPYGMAFVSGYFYVGNQNATRRYEWIRGSRQIYVTGELVMAYDQRGHWTRTVIVSPDFEHIYIGIGSASNVNEEPLPRASVQIANLDGSNVTTFAYGLRNPIGLAFHPITKDLYVACQERDNLGDDLVPDFFTRIEQNDFYGWPYAYMTPNLTDPRRYLANGTNERPDLVSITRTPDVLLQAHSSVLDAQFYTGKQFPSRYQNGAFAAFHGSWNKNQGTGHKIIFIPFDNTTNRPMGYYEDFVTGFLVNPSGPDTFGRPVGLLVLKDGSLLFTEDGNNRIYQVQYKNKTEN